MTYILILVFAATSLIKQCQCSNSEFTYSLDEGYPIGNGLFGGITGVDVDRDGNIIIFHRGSHAWDENSFDANDIYLGNRDSPIPEETVVTIDPKEKKIINSWGSYLFHMPHGLSLDPEGKSVWLTDVALHQIFKYSLKDHQALVTLGSAFIPGNDEIHFCKPTSVVDTGEFVFVADGYCNSRIVMFLASGKFLGEFGQSMDSFTTSSQPRFSIPHKITYAPEAKMLCVADRENGRIQCFNFEPRHTKARDQDDSLVLSGAIKSKFTIVNPEFNHLVFSIDYSPIRGGILVALSGMNYTVNEPAKGFVYNVTTGQLISRFVPPTGKTFGMAHDVAVFGDEAESFFVVDVTPVNIWKFSRPHERHIDSRKIEVTKSSQNSANRAMSIMRDGESGPTSLRYLLLIPLLATVMIMIIKTRRFIKRDATYPFASLYSSNYPASVNSLFGGNRLHRRLTGGSRNGLFGTNTFPRRNFLNLFDRSPQQNNDFSRIPLDESDNSDEDKSDSDVEEFNISQAISSNSIKIDV